MIARAIRWAGRNVELAVALLAVVLVLVDLVLAFFGHAGWALACGLTRPGRIQ